MLRGKLGDRAAVALRATFREAAWNKANELAAQLESEGMGGLYVVVGTVAKRVVLMLP